MPQPVYEQLVDALSARGGAVPALKCKEFLALIEELFTPEEAEMAVQMPLQATSVEALTAKTGGSTEKVEQLLEGMADKGLVTCRERNGVKYYSLLPLMAGIFEYQFMKGEVNDRTKRLARLFEDYFNVIWGSARQGPPTPALLPGARVVTVEREIPAGTEIYPYDQVSYYIRNSEYIAVSTCYCRHHGELLDNPCDKPKEVCLSFGPSAKFNIERGFGRQLTKEEALKILDLSEREGLVHCSSNTGKYVDFICNCCLCHCVVLRSIKESAMPRMVVASGFIVAVDEEECIGCGDCVD
ncbi:MAG: hypothetical protein DRI26_07620, partial [Chloroflexi bacterium]